MNNPKRMDLCNSWKLYSHPQQIPYHHQQSTTTSSTFDVETINNTALVANIIESTKNISSISSEADIHTRCDKEKCGMINSTDYDRTVSEVNYITERYGAPQRHIDIDNRCSSSSFIATSIDRTSNIYTPQISFDFSRIDQHQKSIVNYQSYKDNNIDIVANALPYTNSIESSHRLRNFVNFNDDYSDEFEKYRRLMQRSSTSSNYATNRLDVPQMYDRASLPRISSSFEDPLKLDDGTSSEIQFDDDDGKSKIIDRRYRNYDNNEKIVDASDAFKLHGDIVSVEPLNNIINIIDYDETLRKTEIDNNARNNNFQNYPSSSSNQSSSFLTLLLTQPLQSSQLERIQTQESPSSSRDNDCDRYDVFDNTNVRNGDKNPEDRREVVSSNESLCDGRSSASANDGYGSKSRGDLFGTNESFLNLCTRLNEASKITTLSQCKRYLRDELRINANASVYSNIEELRMFKRVRKFKYQIINPRMNPDTYRIGTYKFIIMISEIFSPKIVEGIDEKKIKRNLSFIEIIADRLDEFMTYRRQVDDIETSNLTFEPIRILDVYDFLKSLRFGSFGHKKNIFADFVEKIQSSVELKWIFFLILRRSPFQSYRVNVLALKRARNYVIHEWLSSYIYKPLRRLILIEDKFSRFKQYLISLRVIGMRQFQMHYTNKNFNGRKDCSRHRIFSNDVDDELFSETMRSSYLNSLYGYILQDVEKMRNCFEISDYCKVSLFSMQRARIQNLPLYCDIVLRKLFEPLRKIVVNLDFVIWSDFDEYTCNESVTRSAVYLTNERRKNRFTLTFDNQGFYVKTKNFPIFKIAGINKTNVENVVKKSKIFIFIQDCLILEHRDLRELSLRKRLRAFYDVLSSRWMLRRNEKSSSFDRDITLTKTNNVEAPSSTPLSTMTTMGTMTTTAITTSTATIENNDRFANISAIRMNRNLPPLSRCSLPRSRFRRKGRSYLAHKRCNEFHDSDKSRFLFDSDNCESGEDEDSLFDTFDEYYDINYLDDRENRNSGENAKHRDNDDDNDDGNYDDRIVDFSYSADDLLNRSTTFELVLFDSPSCVVVLSDWYNSIDNYEQLRRLTNVINFDRFYFSLRSLNEKISSGNFWNVRPTVSEKTLAFLVVLGGWKNGDSPRSSNCLTKILVGCRRSKDIPLLDPNSWSSGEWLPCGIVANGLNKNSLDMIEPFAIPFMPKNWTFFGEDFSIRPDYTVCRPLIFVAMQCERVIDSVKYNSKLTFKFPKVLQILLAKEESILNYVEYCDDLPSLMMKKKPIEVVA